MNLLRWWKPSVWVAHRLSCRCTHCGRDYRVQVPLVVNGRATREVARADEGRLQWFHCPACGTHSAASGPLLFFFSERDAPLVFSPGPLSTLAEADAHLERLLDNARKHLGRWWSETWRNEGVTVTERNELPLALHPPDTARIEELGPVLQPLLGVTSPHEAWDWVSKHPEVLTDRAAAALEDCIRILRVQGRQEDLWNFRFLRQALLRSKRHGIGGGFALRPEEVGPRPGEVRLPARLVAHLMAHDPALDGLHRGDLAALDRGISGMESFFVNQRPGEVDPAFVADAHDRVAALLIERYTAARSGHDLDAAITHLVAAVSMGIVGALASPLRRFATALHLRYGRDGNDEDLRRSLATAGRSTEAAYYQPELARTRIVASTAFRLVAECHLSSGLLVSAERYAQEALDSCPQNAAETADAYVELGRAAAQRYALGGAVDALDRAIDAYSRAIEIEPRRSHAWKGLTGCLLDRYGATGDPAALAWAARAVGQALEELPQDVPELCGLLVNRSAALLEDVARGFDTVALDTAISDLERAIRIAPPGWTELATALNNLGIALDRRSQPGDLEHAVRVLRRAVEVSPATTNDGLRGRYNLATLLRVVAASTGDRACGNEALALLEELARITPTSADSRPAVLYELARHLADEADTSPDARVTDLFREAAGSALARRIPAALQIGLAWGNKAAKRGAWVEAAEAFGVAAEALDLLLALQLDRNGAEAWLTEDPVISADHAIALARAGDLRGAVVVREAGLARLASRGADRTRLAMRASRDEHVAALAARLAAAEQRLAGLVGNTSLELFTRPDAQRAGDLHETRERWATVISEIRDVPGMGDFEARLSFEQIRESAVAAPLVYLVEGRQGACALVVNAGAPEPRVVWLGDGRELDLFEELRPCFTALDSPEPAMDGGIDRAGERLWTLVVEPVLAALDAATEAVFILDGLLSLLPLHMAWSRDSESVSGRRYALDVIRMRYAPNARLLLGRSCTAEAAGRWVGIDRPAPSRSMLLSFGAEASFARACFGDSVLLREEEATISAALCALSHTGVAHFVCHGTVERYDPLASGLVLANDELLTVRTLLELDLPPIRLAVLSACCSGQRGVCLPQEAVGLPTALLQIGVRGVVATLWNVSDFAATLLMVRFYNEWTGTRVHPAEALSRAQRWLRDATTREVMEWFNRAALERGLADSEIQEVLYEFQDAMGGGREFENPFWWAAFAYFGS